MTRPSPSPVTDDGLVERVARGIYARRPFAIASTATTFGAQMAQTFDWDGAPAYYQQDMLELARAALAASDRDVLVGPTDAMIEAGKGAWLDKRGFSDRDVLIAIYTAMTRAALIPLAD